jgi:hypothetical protein
MGLITCCSELGQAFRWERKDKFIAYEKKNKKAKKRQEETRRKEKLREDSPRPSIQMGEEGWGNPSSAEAGLGKYWTGCHRM